MENLKIRDFITLSNVDFEINRYNIIIGRQSSGKSLIAKLLYFFRSDFRDAFLSTITGDDENSPEDANSTKFKRRLDKKLLQRFVERFNPDYWGLGEFLIEYTNNDHKIILKRNKSKIKIEISENFRSDFIKIRSSFLEYSKTDINIPDAIKGDISFFLDRYSSEHKSISSIPSFMLSPSIYIPAGRGFFALLEQNIFSFLSMNSTIDKFISDFGSFYSNAKRFYIRRSSSHSNISIKGFQEAVNDIIGGEFKYKNDTYVISQKNGIDIQLENASSGQQEVVPMLVSLLFMSNIMQYRRGGSALFIEEPEAHLFPKTQKDIIYSIAALHNKLNLTTLITTHSPYVLSSLNNLIIADIAQEEINRVRSNIEKNKKLDLIIKQEWRIKRNDYSAYSIDNKGTLVNIIGKDGLIGVNNIDEISEDISNEFDSILNLLYGE